MDLHHLTVRGYYYISADLHLMQTLYVIVLIAYLGLQSIDIATVLIAYAYGGLQSILLSLVFHSPVKTPGCEPQSWRHPAYLASGRGETYPFSCFLAVAQGRCPGIAPGYGRFLLR